MELQGPSAPFVLLIMSPKNTITSPTAHKVRITIIALLYPLCFSRVGLLSRYKDLWRSAGNWSTWLVVIGLYVSWLSV